MDPDCAPRLVVIGYGNEMRGDDGAGVVAAVAVEELGLPGVEVETRHQLTPELSELLAVADVVVFLDAAVPGGGAVRAREVQPGAESGWTGHAGTPESILALTVALHGRQPRVWCVEIPVERFGWGPGLSEEATAGAACAVDLVRQIWAEWRCVARSGEGAAGEVARSPLTGAREPCTKPA